MFCRRMNAGGGAVGLILLTVLLIGLLDAGPLKATGISIPEGAASFDLEEVSIYDLPPGIRMRFISGLYCRCGLDPDGTIQRYPDFKSDKPLYGSFEVGKSSAGPETGYRYAIAIDESAGPGRGYDRLYLDLNLNGDLTDDAVCRPTQDVPENARIASSAIQAQACFGTIALKISEGGPQDHLEVMPRFVAYNDDRYYAMLVSTKAYKGTIEIGGKRLDVVLGHGRRIPGWFDHPDTTVYLLPENEPGSRPLASWYGGDRLKAMHRLGQTYYRLAASPKGDKLFVWPYQGPFGTLEVGSGQLSVAKIVASGSLSSKDSEVSLIDELGQGGVSSSGPFRLPVGDYCPALLSVQYDDLSCLVLRNRHADGSPGGRSELGPAVYGIKIREGEPFVFNFSGKPQVVFASPMKGYRVQLGDELSVQAVLTDPVLDIMFRQISQKGALDPTVKIARANGDIVAEGTMPFG